MYSLRRPLIVSGVPIAEEIDTRIAKLVDVPWSLHAFERISLIPGQAFDPAAAHAAAVMLDRFSPHDRIVMLGKEVCTSFDMDIPPLTFAKRTGRAYLHLSDPWDDEDEASRSLQAFLDGP